MGCLYRLNFPNGKSYIGITKFTAEERFLVHCAIAMKGKKSWAVHRAIKKYGMENIKVETLIKADELYLFEAEIKAIRIFNTKQPEGYNLTSGGDGVRGLTEETLSKMSASQKGKVRSNEMKEKLRAFFKGKPLSAEHRKKISESQKGKIITPEALAKSAETRRNKGSAFYAMTDEARAHLSAVNKGKTFSEETRARLSAANKGRVHSAEIRANMRASKLGKKASEETKLKMSEAQKKRQLLRRQGDPETNSYKPWTERI